MALLTTDVNRTLPTEAPITSKSSSSTFAALEAIKESSKHSDAYAREVADSAMKAVRDAQESSRQLQARLDNLQKVISDAGSFDAKWDAFKNKFDELTKLAVDKMRGQFGAFTPQRPAEMISEERVAQVLARSSNIVVLTGAGISAESGIPTFRGADGFWTVGSKNYQPQELATWEKFNEMPEELWRWYQYRWGICTKAKPNPGHHALVALQDLVRGSFTLVTQNVDGLHLQAGSDRSRLYEIHGRIDEMRCDERVPNACLHGLSLEDPDHFAAARATVFKTPPAAEKEKDEKLPHCSKCGVRQRPKILWFDECYNEAFYGSKSVRCATEMCDVLLIIGTQLTTGMPSNMVQTALSSGATIIKMDTIVDLSDERSAGMLHVQAKSGEALPRIVEKMRKMLREPALAPLKQVSELKGSELKTQKFIGANLKAISTVHSKAAPPRSPVQSASHVNGTFNPSRASRNHSSTPTPARVSTPPANSRSSSVARVTTPPASSRSGSVGRTTSSSNSTTTRKDVRSRSSVTFKAAASASLKSFASKDFDSTAEGFFVYGTLRPDDNSGASWTKSFCEGLSAEVAVLPGASLYIDGSYPAVCLEQTQFSVRGVFLRPTSASDMSAKLLEADRIESYPDLYDRTVVRVQTEAGVDRLAYLYHRTGLIDRSKCECIADGDWLSRRRGK